MELVINLNEDPVITEGMLRIESENVKTTVEWTPILDIGGKRFPLTSPRTIIGRGSDASTCGSASKEAGTVFQYIQKTDVVRVGPVREEPRRTPVLRLKL